MGIDYASVPQSELASSGVLPVAGSPTLDTEEQGYVSRHYGSSDKNNNGVRTAGSRYESAKRALGLASLLTFGLVLGFCVGRKHPAAMETACGVATAADPGSSAAEGKPGLLPSWGFVPEMPMTEVKFTFPTPYGDTSVEGDMLWNALMPVGSGFVRVPNPRQYDMPASKPIEDDPDDAEIYSLSVLHQLHCLGVIRDVVKKYETHDKSRFAGEGHEYHCIDYLRQSIMCAGDMTLDFAEVQADGVRRGFSGANSAHQCRDWDSIVQWAELNREGDKKGIP